MGGSACVSKGESIVSSGLEGSVPEDVLGDGTLKRELTRDGLEDSCIEGGGGEVGGED